ncbi:hypothetical protein [Streptomyces aurantiogriseus]|uniref:Uncharacterized protein n=1 Tax=Streptomyces aurantiogriseus TaxID=66870 RepID=A0A918L098_9ACTN|nr:hypothetical protein [Streptomyces aurantiogriseus]GGR63640.1 hypothetical protein GCM10010251_95340 [Streptomyces aurantiogriseus]
MLQATRRRAVRATAAALCTAALTLSQANPAAAAEKKVSFAFMYRMDTQAWKQKMGKVSILFTWCRNQRSFHATLMRDDWGSDTKLEGHALTCIKGKRAYFDAKTDGTYYFTFTKADDGNFVEGNATISYPAA